MQHICPRNSVYCAHFDEFVWRDQDGVRFANRVASESKRHHDRVWPALARYKRVRQTTERWHNRVCPARIMKLSQHLEAACLLTVLRRWDPCNPLERWHITQCDRAQRPPRYDDFAMPPNVIRGTLRRGFTRRW